MLGVAPPIIHALGVLPRLDAERKDEERDKRDSPLPADRRVAEDDLVQARDVDECWCDGGAENNTIEVTQLSAGPFSRGRGGSRQ